MARFYGVDPSAWKPGKLAAWEANITRVWAEETLRERGGGLTSQQLYHVVWMATGDKRQAERARLRRALEEARSAQA